MIHGAHAIIYSKDADADRAFVRDVLKYRFADAGHGWLIFALPPAEVAFHPSDENDVHELYLMCDDVVAFRAEMQAKGVATTPVREERWGLITRMTLPGGGKLGVYQPRHPSPLPARPATTAKKKAAGAKTAPAERAPARRARKAGTATRPRRTPRAK